MRRFPATRTRAGERGGGSACGPRRGGRGGRGRKGGGRSDPPPPGESGSVTGSALIAYQTSQSANNTGILSTMAIQKMAQKPSTSAWYPGVQGRYQAIGRWSRKNPLVGPSAGNVASQTIVSAASSGERGAADPPMSVRTQPGHMALTFTSPRAPRANCRVIAFSAAFEML